MGPQGPSGSNSQAGRRRTDRRRKGCARARSGRKPALPDPKQGRPEDRVQRNLTDPETRILPDDLDKSKSAVLAALPCQAK